MKNNVVDLQTAKVHRTRKVINGQQANNQIIHQYRNSIKLNLAGILQMFWFWCRGKKHLTVERRLDISGNRVRTMFYMSKNQCNKETPPC